MKVHYCISKEACAGRLRSVLDGVAGLYTFENLQLMATACGLVKIGGDTDQIKQKLALANEIQWKSLLRAINRGTYVPNNGADKDKFPLCHVEKGSNKKRKMVPKDIDRFIAAFASFLRTRGYKLENAFDTRILESLLSEFLQRYHTIRAALVALFTENPTILRSAKKIDKLYSQESAKELYLLMKYIEQGGFPATIENQYGRFAKSLPEGHEIGPFLEFHQQTNKAKAAAADRGILRFERISELLAAFLSCAAEEGVVVVDNKLSGYGFEAVMKCFSENYTITPLLMQFLFLAENEDSDEVLVETVDSDEEEDGDVEVQLPMVLAPGNRALSQPNNFGQAVETLGMHGAMMNDGASRHGGRNVTFNQNIIYQGAVYNGSVGSVDNSTNNNATDQAKVHENLERNNVTLEKVQATLEVTKQDVAATKSVAQEGTVAAKQSLAKIDDQSNILNSVIKTPRETKTATPLGGRDLFGAKSGATKTPARASRSARSKSTAKRQGSAGVENEVPTNTAQTEKLPQCKALTKTTKQRCKNSVHKDCPDGRFCHTHLKNGKKAN